MRCDDMQLAVASGRLAGRLTEIRGTRGAGLRRRVYGIQRGRNTAVDPDIRYLRDSDRKYHDNYRNNYSLPSAVYSNIQYTRQHHGLHLHPHLDVHPSPHPRPIPRRLALVPSLTASPSLASVARVQEAKQACPLAAHCWLAAGWLVPSTDSRSTTPDTQTRGVLGGMYHVL